MAISLTIQEMESGFKNMQAVLNGNRFSCLFGMQNPVSIFHMNNFQF